MTKEQIKQKAHEIGWQTSKHYDPNVCKQEWCEMAARDMAEYILSNINVVKLDNAYSNDLLNIAKVWSIEHQKEALLMSLKNYVTIEEEKVDNNTIVHMKIKVMK